MVLVVYTNTANQIIHTYIAIFVQLESFHLFDALTFILHHSHSSFRLFNRTSLVTSS